MQQARMTHLPDVLIVGHVTRDLMGQRELLGGAAAFAAQAASCLGMRAAMVTSAPDPFALMQPLRLDPALDVTCVQAEQETTFEVSYPATGRQLRVLARARDVRLADVPVALRSAPLAFVAPVVGECDRELVEGLKAQVVMAGIQGWLRTLGPRGEVRPAPSRLIESPPQNLDAVVFSELDHPESDALARHLAAAGVLVALTRGREGVSLFLPERVDVPAAQAVEVDPTGAGDVFGLVFGTALVHGLSPVVAAQRAVVAAARVVEGPGLGNLSHYAEGLSAWAARSRPRLAARAAAPAARQAAR